MSGKRRAPKEKGPALAWLSLLVGFTRLLVEIWRLWR